MEPRPTTTSIDSNVPNEGAINEGKLNSFNLMNCYSQLMFSFFLSKPVSQHLVAERLCYESRRRPSQRLVPPSSVGGVEVNGNVQPEF